MRRTLDLLASYAASCRDQRNISTHFFSVPTLLLALSVLLARPAFSIGTLGLTPIWLIWLPAALWYLSRGSLALGTAVTLATAALAFLAQPFAAGSTLAWLAWGVGLFALGSTVKMLGFYYEGGGSERSQATDFRSLLVAPMFVTAEALFALGWNRPLLAAIEQRVGRPVLRDLASGARA